MPDFLAFHVNRAQCLAPPVFGLHGSSKSSGSQRLVPDLLQVFHVAFVRSVVLRCQFGTVGLDRGHHVRVFLRVGQLPRHHRSRALFVPGTHGGLFQGHPAIAGHVFLHKLPFLGIQDLLLPQGADLTCKALLGLIRDHRRHVPDVPLGHAVLHKRQPLSTRRIEKVQPGLWTLAKRIAATLAEAACFSSLNRMLSPESMSLNGYVVRSSGMGIFASICIKD